MSPIVSNRDLLRVYVDPHGVKHLLIGIATDLLLERVDNGHRTMWTRRAFDAHFERAGSREAGESE